MEKDDQLEWSARSLFVTGFFVELGLVLLGAALGYLFLSHPFPFRLVLDTQGLLVGLLATVPMVLFAFALTSRIAARIGFLREMEGKLKAYLGSGIRAMTIQEIILLSAAAGVGEEILFRGVLQTLSGSVWGLWVASVIFGLLHAVTPAYFALATLMGLYLGALYIATNNLLAPILVHWLYDTVALYLLRRQWLKEDEEETKREEEKASQETKENHQPE